MTMATRRRMRYSSRQCLNIFCTQTTINTIDDRTIRLLIANVPLLDAESLDGAVVLGTGIGTGLPSGALRFVGC